MPNFNGMGPNNEGPMTGRRQGNCNDETKTTNNRPRRGLGNNRKFDGTGPNGKGPKTGRRQGNC